jgi:hypothetical protein
MSGSSERGGATVRALCVAMTLSAGLAIAGMSPPPSPGPSLGPHTQTQARAGSPSAVEPGSGPRGRGLLRCWQFGRLIYQGPGNAVDDRLAGSTRVAAGPGVQIYDLKSATCILEDAGR